MSQELANFQPISGYKKTDLYRFENRFFSAAGGICAGVLSSFVFTIPLDSTSLVLGASAIPAFLSYYGTNKTFTKMEYASLIRFLTKAQGKPKISRKAVKKLIALEKQDTPTVIPLNEVFSLPADDKRVLVLDKCNMAVTEPLENDAIWDRAMDNVSNQYQLEKTDEVSFPDTPSNMLEGNVPDPKKIMDIIAKTIQENAKQKEQIMHLQAELEAVFSATKNTQ